MRYATKTYAVCICKDFLDENKSLLLCTSEGFYNYIEFYILFLTSNFHLVIFALFYSSSLRGCLVEVKCPSCSPFPA